MPACRQPAHAWFLKIVSLRMSVCVFLYVCVCPSTRLLINSGVIWTPYDWLNNFYSFYMAAEVVTVIGSGRGLRIKTHCGN